MLIKTRYLSILRFSAEAGKSGPILCLDKFWAFMLQVASVQLFTATILLLPYSAWAKKHLSAVLKQLQIKTLESALAAFSVTTEIPAETPTSTRNQKNDDERTEQLSEPSGRQDLPTPTVRQNALAPAIGLLNPPGPQNNQQQPIRTIRYYLAEDLDGLNHAIMIPEFMAEHFELKPVMLNMLNILGQFGGTPHENASQHLKSFVEICNSFKIHGVSNDVIKMKSISYSLRDKAKA
ncbi:hypothetical protein V6N13_124021 [Hibiscus sabdariffa]